jgi:Domain of unknown function (DUF222)/HNH endonuclease
VFVNLGTLTNERLEADIAYLAVEIDRCMHRWLELVAEFDRRDGALVAGFRGTAEWLAWRCSLDRRTARDHVSVARRLAEWPEMRAAYVAGELSYSKLRALSRASADADEAALVMRARETTTDRLEQTVRSLRSAASADVDVAKAAHDARHLTWHWDDDGSLRFHGRLGPDEGAALVEALEAGAEALHPAPPPQAEQESIARPPLGARRADALTECVFSSAPRAQIVLHVDTEALACTAVGDEPRAGEICGLEEGPAVPSETARRLACDGEVITDHGRRRRVVSPALRTALERRDGRCRFPGCDRRHGLHAHHIEHWAHGGGTDRDNLVMLCRFHHRAVHEDGFTVAIEDGDHVFRHPEGQRIDEVPPVPLAIDRGPPVSVVAA